MFCFFIVLRPNGRFFPPERYMRQQRLTHAFKVVAVKGFSRAKTNCPIHLFWRRKLVLIKLTSERPVTFTFGKETVTTNVKRLQSGSRIRSGPSGFTSESALPNHQVTAFSADVEKKQPKHPNLKCSYRLYLYCRCKITFDSHKKMILLKIYPNHILIETVVKNVSSVYFYQSN